MSKLSRPSFKEAALWRLAMTHCSFANEQTDIVEHNERLEFLGDAILTFLSGDYLYRRYPHKSEGELTKIRAALVDQSQLAHFAKVLDLSQDLQLGIGTEKEGGRSSSRLLCSAFEAVVGAYFLDTGRDISAVGAYVIPFFESVVDSVVEKGAKDDKTQLQEWSQKTLGAIPEYVAMGSSGPDHNKEFIVEVQIAGKKYGQGRGKSKQKAQKAAARATLDKIEDFF